MSLEVEDMFQGKTVSFSSVSETLAMKDISFQTIQDRLFVVGRIPLGATSKDSALNNTCAIAWNSVQDFLVFDSEQDYFMWIEASES
ncbi:hypothetical protein [Litoribrevibacter albus]|uniref:Uncharacterized protein n=1 Tax=Litoribrevibacter albus TaxID=1473156 RepID=A0AA37W7H1_9GAMM|nr:hypothetical protein [Litoribrevibacter albus]GLQ31363.1 hypothetical protein GCM10007876_18420 [Litoribrevibacter albus]